MPSVASPTRRAPPHRPRPFVLAGIALAAAFAVMALLPVASQRADGTYGGLPVLPTATMRLEAARAQEIRDGRWLASSPFLAEGKDEPPFRLPLAEEGIAIGALLTGSDAADAYVAALGVLSFALFLLCTAFLTRLTLRPWVSLAASCLALSGMALFLRPDFPAPSAGLLWILCWTFGALRLLLSWNAADSRRALAGAAACAAVLLSSSPAAGTALAIAMLLLFVLCMARGDMRRMKELLGFFAVFAFLSIPYGVLLSKLLLHPLYAESAPRLGLLPLRFPAADPRALLPIIAALLGWKLWGAHRRLVLCLAAGASIAFFCLPLITGVRPPPQAALAEAVLPLGLALAAVFLCAVFLNVVRGRIGLAAGWGVAVMASVLPAMRQQHGAYAAVRPEWAAVQDLAPVLRVLRAQEPAVVHVRDPLARDLVAAHTAQDVASADGAVFSLQSVERLQDAYFFDLWLDGLVPQDAAEHFRGQGRAEMAYRLHGLQYPAPAGEAPVFPDDVLQRHAAAYRGYAARTDAERLCLHPVDFLILSGDEPGTDAWTALKALGKPLAQSGKLSLLALDRPKECPRPAVPGGR